MERCPTCNAKYTGKRICHRCKSDLGLLLDTEQEAGEYLEKAMSAFAEKDFNQMFLHAKRACALQRTPEAARVLACASLLVNKFDMAMNHWSFASHHDK
ncbi:hypothetical protein [Desulfonema magnum]|uniref:Uncharacterized protein n=1 Tax=Desulfonema magnum TaxID=45655 RepID=A0A975BII1_9BACT|nr:hypothetical protein [Desulfonema magnum]QTA86012.1 Uncharacterized protein dnm_020300 [Desulfonema magnum]